MGVEPIILLSFVAFYGECKMGNALTTWFSGLEPMLQIYWVVAAVSSLVFITMMALSFLGGGHDGGEAGGVDLDGDGIPDAVDLDGDGIPDAFEAGDAGGVGHVEGADGDLGGLHHGMAGEFHMFTVKTLLAFMMAFGWTGVLLYEDFADKLYVALLAVGVGGAFMTLIAVMFSQLNKFSQNSVFHARQAIGCEADVYLRIPGGLERGKITVSCGGCLHELDAYSDSEIPTGAKVLIYDAVDGSTVRVDPI